MEDVLDLYEEAYDANRPVVCFDEKLYQLVGHTQEPIQASPRHCRREDYEYTREGACNIFVLVEPKGGKRRVKVTASSDYPGLLKDNLNGTLSLFIPRVGRADFDQRGQPLHNFASHGADAFRMLAVGLGKLANTGLTAEEWKNLRQKYM